MFLIPADIVAELSAVAADDPALDLSRWDGSGVPGAVVLRWVEQQPPSSLTVALLAEIQPGELADDDRPRLLAELQRAESHLSALRFATIGSLPGRPADPHDPRMVDAAPYDVAVALRMPLGAAQTEVFRARRLRTHLAATFAAMTQGELSARHAAAIVTATSHLARADCEAIEERVLPGAALLSASEFAAKVRRAVAAHDPVAFAGRHRRAAADSDVVCQPDDDAMAWLNARMPLVDAVVVKTAVDAYASSRKAGGDGRPIGMLRAEALRVFADRYLTGDDAPSSHGRSVEVHIAATPAALVGLVETPAEIPGVGPVPIEVVRDIAREARMRLLTIDPDDGHLLDYGRSTYRVPSALAAHVVARDVRSVAPYSTVPARRADIDHLNPFPAGPTSEPNLAAFDRGWHRGKTHANVTATRRSDGGIDWTTPLGQGAVTRPYDYRLGP